MMIETTMGPNACVRMMAADGATFDIPRADSRCLWPSLHGNQTIGWDPASWMDLEIQEPRLEEVGLDMLLDCISDGQRRTASAEGLLVLKN